MSDKRTAVSIGGKKEDVFLAGVEYLAKKYQIKDYTLITENSYHITGKTEAEIEVKRELINIFNK